MEERLGESHKENSRLRRMSRHSMSGGDKEAQTAALEIYRIKEQLRKSQREVEALNVKLDSERRDFEEGYLRLESSTFPLFVVVVVIIVFVMVIL